MLLGRLERIDEEEYLPVEAFNYFVTIAVTAFSYGQAKLLWNYKILELKRI
jgi:hypothetical protein